MLFFSAVDVPVFPHSPVSCMRRSWGAGARPLVVGSRRERCGALGRRRPRAARRLGSPRGRHSMFEGLFSPPSHARALLSPARPPAASRPGNARPRARVLRRARPPRCQARGVSRRRPPPRGVHARHLGRRAAGRFYHESCRRHRAARRARRAAHGRIRADRPAAARRRRAARRSHAAGCSFRAPAPSSVRAASARPARRCAAGARCSVVPHGHDQPDNALPRNDLGVSRTIYARRYDATHVARALARLLRDDYREHTATTAAMPPAQDDSADAAVAALERGLRLRGRLIAPRRPASFVIARRRVRTRQRHDDTVTPRTFGVAPVSPHTVCFTHRFDCGSVRALHARRSRPSRPCSSAQ